MKTAFPEFIYSCPDCGHEMEYEITPEVEPRLSGRPEDCYEGESGYACGPEVCGNCQQQIDAGTVYDAWSKNL